MSEALNKLKSSLLSVIPVVTVVFVLHFTKASVFTGKELTVFGISSALIVIGMCLFNIGAESSMQKMGEFIGSTVTKRRSIWFLILIFFLFGLFVTIAEPDLNVLAEQATSDISSKIFLMISVGIGVGIFLVIGAIRILFQKSLKLWLLAFYGLMFALCCLIDKVHIPLSLDSGGVTTGPITVPFILAVGVGIASSRAGNKQNADSFGLVAFCSIGPILVVLILSLLLRDFSSTFNLESIDQSLLTGTIISPFLNTLLGLDGSLIRVTISILPVLVFFFLYDYLFLKLPKRKLVGLLIGALFVYFGLIIFITSVEAGFLPIGQKLGFNIANLNTNVLVIIGAVLGLTAVLAEPAVHVLTGQIEKITEGSVNKIAVFITIAVGNALAVALAMLRVKYGFDLMYIIVPGYVIAFFISFIVPDICSAIAFDAGGVVSGPMNSTFILPFAIGACYAINGSSKASSAIMTDAFGTIGIVALMPLLLIQMLGLFATIKIKSEQKIARHRTTAEFDNQIIHF